MAIKTFNIDPSVHKKFSEHCKDHGMSMSKQIELFMRCQIAKNSEERQVHESKLHKLRQSKSHMSMDDFADTL